MTDIATDGSCGLSWDDSIITSMTPAPSARCPFEAFHEYDDNDNISSNPLMPRDIPADWPVEPLATLEGMTQQRWNVLTDFERSKLRDYSGLTTQLIGLEGWRVEVDAGYETRRFIVGRSTGWKPIHIELHRRDSSGGMGASKQYESVKKLYQVRERSYT